MKCKRCRAHVPDDSDTCPLCGQDLTALRQLLRDFYREEAIPLEELRAEPTFSQKRESEIREEPAVAQGPRVIYPGESSPGVDDAAMGNPETEKPEEPDQGFPAERDFRAGFWLRFMAFAIDFLLLLFISTAFVTMGFIFLTLGSSGGREILFFKQARVIIPTLFPFSCVLALIYFSFFHAAWGKTLGKMIFGLRLIRMDGEAISFLRGLGRTFAYILSAVPFFLGFIWTGFSREKRAWHDLIAGTRVIRE